MPARLATRYPINTLVEITFGDDSWLTARVVDHAFPGVWVEAHDGHLWFVIHPSRIRQAGDMPSAAEHDQPNNADVEPDDTLG